MTRNNHYAISIDTFFLASSVVLVVLALLLKSTKVISISLLSIVLAVGMNVFNISISYQNGLIVNSLNGVRDRIFLSRLYPKITNLRHFVAIFCFENQSFDSNSKRCNIFIRRKKQAGRLAFFSFVKQMLKASVKRKFDTCILLMF